MRTILICTCTVIILCILVSFTRQKANDDTDLRKIYSQSPEHWPRPLVAPGVKWEELGFLMVHPLFSNKDSVPHLVALGKVLFFDPRISGSGTISCASCHQPKESWADGMEKSVGHNGTVTKRNTQSLQNVWFYKRLFWDGRSSSLEDQVFSPINSESEMHGDMPGLPHKLEMIPGYAALFDSAFGDAKITPDRIASALATFQRSISSNPSAFDSFLLGYTDILTESELRGLHVFRTKAGCMNCHYGPMFTDNQFHNNGFAGDDKGLYNQTHKVEDIGKFRTPSLRDVTFTGPWMHDGMQKNPIRIIDKYIGPATPRRDPLIRTYRLSDMDKEDLYNFLRAISSPPISFEIPQLPQ